MNNPVFKETNKIIIEENCKEVSNILVYQLKNISNAFYLACLIHNTDIQIFKYSYETKSFKNIGKIDVICSYNESMKYFYNPLNNKEYFFFNNNNNELEIYLIKNENNFQLIRKLNYINMMILIITIIIIFFNLMILMVQGVILVVKMVIHLRNLIFSIYFITKMIKMFMPL